VQNSFATHDFSEIRGRFKGTRTDGRQAREDDGAGDACRAISLLAAWGKRVADLSAIGCAKEDFVILAVLPSNENGDFEVPLTIRVQETNFIDSGR
jgi:hypothetical protein